VPKVEDEAPAAQRLRDLHVRGPSGRRSARTESEQAQEHQHK
jgi:hypothetical protein